MLYWSKVPTYYIMFLSFYIIFKKNSGFTVILPLTEYSIRMLSGGTIPGKGFRGLLLIKPIPGSFFPDAVAANIPRINSYEILRKILQFLIRKS